MSKRCIDMLVVAVEIRMNQWSYGYCYKIMILMFLGHCTFPLRALMSKMRIDTDGNCSCGGKDESVELWAIAVKITLLIFMNKDFRFDLL